MEAFDELGGVPALVKWGKRSPGAFYALWCKLLPVQVTGEDGEPIKVQRIELVALDGDSNG